MRSTQLLRIAAQAEVLLLKRQAKTAQRRVIYGAVAAVFAIAVLVSLHVLAAMALVQYAGLSAFMSTLVVFVIDLVVAGIFGLLASGTVKDPVIEEARSLRDRSLAQAKDNFSAAAVLVPAGRMLGRKHIYGLALAALTARFLGANARAR